MPFFKYKAVDVRGRSRRGGLDAANLTDLEQRLQRMGLDLVTCHIHLQKEYLPRSRKVGRPELINFCFHMQQLTSAGVPLLEGLADLRDSMEHPRFREVVANLIDEVEGGKNLSGAMAEHPTVFDTLFINLIAAGEVSGHLAEVFGSLTTTLKWQDELASQTKRLLLFPAFVAVVVLGVTFFLMVYLVPQLVHFIKEMGQALPLHTRALIVVSDFCINFWYVILLGPPAIFLFVRQLAARNIEVRRFLDDQKLRVWMIGPVLKKIILSRFANFFGMMYAAGIPVLQCLEISEGVVDNMVVREALREATGYIGQGMDVSTSFEQTRIFPPLVVRMLRVGESTGALDEALLNVSYFYDRDVKEMISRIQSMIEPVMTVVLGMILGWVMLSVLGPIYDTISKIKY